MVYIFSLLHLYRYYCCYHQYTFFVYLFIPLSPSSELSLLLQSVYIFFPLFIPLIFSHRVPSNLFQKLILHIFEKRKKVVSEQACLLQAGR